MLKLIPKFLDLSYTSTLVRPPLEADRQKYNIGKINI